MSEMSDKSLRTGGFMKQRMFNKTFAAGLAVFAFVELFNITDAFINGNLFSGKPSPVLLFTYMIIGIVEETVFRILPGRVFGGKLTSVKREAAFIIITSLAFGLFHLVNLLSGASLSYTVLQIVFAASIGSFFCLLFLKTGSPVLIVVMHIAHDMITGFNTPELTGGVIYSLPLSMRDIIVVAVQALIFVGFVILFITADPAGGRKQV